MKCSIISVGQKPPSWVAAGLTEYQKRLSQTLHIDWIDIPLKSRHKSQVEQSRRQESDVILSRIPDKAQVIALDEHGKSYTSLKLAEHIETWQGLAKPIVFLIGGPEGLSPECLARANQKWSLSDLTLPHPLVKIILIETLYRSVSILAGHPYHRE